MDHHRTSVPLPIDTPTTIVGASRRHPGDLLRVVLGLIVVVLGAAAIHMTKLSAFETDVFRLLNDLPVWMRDVLNVVAQLGNVITVVVLAVLALVMVRSWRLPTLLLLSGVTSWVAAKTIKSLVGRERPAALLDNVVVNGALANGLGYPSGHAAVAAALATAAAPYLTRAQRRLAWLLVWIVAVGRVATGAHFPFDVIGGVALGWAIGSFWNLVFGSPSVPIPVETVRSVLALAGIDITAVRQLTVDARGSIPLRIESLTETYFAKVLLGQHRDADWLYKSWRRLSRRVVEDETPFVSVKHQVEHEAYVSMLAQRGGVATPAIILASALDARSAILVTEWCNGVPISASDGHLPTDLWTVVGTLHSLRIAHRDLRMANLMVVDDKTNVLDFGFAEASASDDRMAVDTAEVLVNSAIVVGAPKAAELALAHVPPDQLKLAAKYLQPLALAHTTRTALRHDRHLLNDLRLAVAGEHPPRLAPIARFTWRTAVVLILLGVGVHVLLPQVGELKSSLSALQSADFWLLGAAFVAAAGTYVATAVGLNGTTTVHLSLVRTTLVQLANQFLNVLAPAGIAGFSTNIRYFVRSGIAPEAAVAAIGLHMAVAVIVHTTMLMGAAVWVGSVASTLPHVPAKWVIVAAVAGVAVVAGVISTGVGRRKVVAPVLGGIRSLGPILRDPRRSLVLFGGAVGVNVAYILALFLSLHAVGSPVSLLDAATAYLIGAIVGSVTPTPGGLGGTEAALVAALVGFGLDAGPAVAGVLAFRAITFWIPLLPGAYVARHLQREQIL